ncbi:GNAT family N-acetyltransferase [Pedobacter sp. SYSU D00535]|uniref:GNAT family N-acetyltransferase n=1 Tax=Pedobacter sp. SYSU D00535 TaxID=2810308 RepID=UPI001A973CCA|nr:GNAT family N-acetyltransferase [Pedobacter sp. SYSU D00535]
MQVEEITTADIGLLPELQPDGWPDITPHFRFYVSQSFCNPLKFSIFGKIVGTGAIIFHRNSAWLGHILVHKDYRNRGIGALITETLVDRVRQSGREKISLIAAPMGEPIYRKLGFERELEYYFFRNVDFIARSVAEPRIQEYSAAYFDQLLSLDREATGEDRSVLLREFLEEAKVFVDHGVLRGFYLPALSEGLVVAKDTEAGLKLMELRLCNVQVAVMPDTNIAAADFLLKNDFKLVQQGWRMRLGKQLSYDSRLIFNRIGGNMG